MGPSATSPAPPRAPSIPVPGDLNLLTPFLPKPTQNALMSHLQASNSIPALSELLSDSLARTGWTDRVRALALELLRSGECSTFPELRDEVLRRAKIPKPEPRDETGAFPPPQQENRNSANGARTGSTLKASSKTNANGGLPSANGHVGTIVLPDGSRETDGWPDVRIPQKTVEDGVEFLKTRIKDLVEVVPSDEEGDSD